MRDTGNVKFVDDYGQYYESNWTKSGNRYDITTITKMPFVWGEEQSGYVKNNSVYRKGIVTIIRQIIEVIDDSYSVIAEGQEQKIDYIKTNFHCEQFENTRFQYYLDNPSVDETAMIIDSGSRFADPTKSADNVAVWCELDNDGNQSDVTAGYDYLEWIDVWPSIT